MASVILELHIVGFSFLVPCFLGIPFSSTMVSVILELHIVGIRFFSTQELQKPWYSNNEIQENMVLKKRNPTICNSRITEAL